MPSSPAPVFPKQCAAKPKRLERNWWTCRRSNLARHARLLQGWMTGVIISMNHKIASLWRNRDFLKLWSGQTVSMFGSLITRTALPFTAILVLKASPFQMSLLLAADLVPGFVMGLVAGVWVDRLRRRPIMIGADLGRAVLLVSIPVAASLGLLHIGQLYAVALLTGSLTVFFDVAYRSYLPTLVRREQLVEANSRLTATASAAEVGAFGIGGWLVQLFSAPLAILIDSFSFLCSAVFVGLIRTSEPPPLPKTERKGLLPEIGEGLRVVLGDPFLRVMAGCAVAVELHFGVFGTLFLLYTSRELGFEPGLLGLIFAVGGLSSLLGASVAGPSARWLGIGRAMTLGLLLFSLAGLLAPFARGATVFAAVLLIAQQVFGDGAFTAYEVNQISLRQVIAPSQMLGRVNASMQFASLVATVIGSLVGGLLGEAVGLRSTLVIGACVTLPAVLWLMLSPLQTVEDQPNTYKA